MMNALVINAFAALFFAAHSSCTENATSMNCTLTGAGYFEAEINEEELCRNFKRRLADDLGASGEAGVSGEFSIVLQVQKRGRIKAVITAKSASNVIQYPEVGIEVMDRALMPKDLEDLASAAAQVIVRH